MLWASVASGPLETIVASRRAAGPSRYRRIDRRPNQRLWVAPPWVTLEKLKIRSKAVTGAGLALLADQPELEDLWLAGTNADDQALSYLHGHRKLREIDLRDTKVTDAGLAYLGTMPALETLWLEELPLTDAGLTRLEGLPRLRKVFLRHTRAIVAGRTPRNTIAVEAVQRLSRAVPSLEWVVLPDGRRIGRPHPAD